MDTCRRLDRHWVCKKPSSNRHPPEENVLRPAPEVTGLSKMTRNLRESCCTPAGAGPRTAGSRGPSPRAQPRAPKPLPRGRGGAGSTRRLRAALQNNPAPHPVTHRRVWPWPRPCAPEVGPEAGCRDSSSPLTASRCPEVLKEAGPGSPPCSQPPGAAGEEKFPSPPSAPALAAPCPLRS